MFRGVDPLAIIERAYAIDLPEKEWLEGILQQATPALDAGHGTLAYLYDASARPLNVWGFVGEFEPPIKEIIDVIRAADDDYVAQSFLVTPFGTASEQPGFDRQRTFGRRLHKFGIQDALTLNCFDNSGLGAWIGALLPDRRSVEEPERESWAKVAVHVTAALRLRKRLEHQRKETPAAVLSTNGKVEHVEDAIASERSNLADAVRALERARGRMRKADPEGAMDAWKVLVRARWSLVDEFESDGKRVVLAYQNAPTSHGPETFSAREREVVSLALLGHSPKLIAYELGLAASTVRVHLTNASRKLGVRSRSALIDKYRAWLFRQQSA